MSLLEWRDDFSVGIEAVDHEHRELIELINSALTNIDQNGSHSESLDHLGEIYTKISSHFALEERVMRDARYDEYDEHKDDHDRLLDLIRDMMDDYEDDRDIDKLKFAEQLNHWFTDHFNSKDARMHKHLKT